MVAIAHSGMGGIGIGRAMSFALGWRGERRPTTSADECEDHVQRYSLQDIVQLIANNMAGQKIDIRSQIELPF